MGLINKIRAAWKSQTTEQKIGFVFDILCDIGCAFAGADIGRKLSEGHNIAGRICIRTATTGLAVAGGNLAARTLKEEYGESLAGVIDGVKKKIAENSKKEEEESDA